MTSLIESAKVHPEYSGSVYYSCVCTKHHDAFYAGGLDGAAKSGISSSISPQFALATDRMTNEPERTSQPGVMNMAFEPAEARVAVTEAVQPRIEIVMQLPDDTPAASDAHPRPMLVDAFRTNEPGDGNAVAAYLSLWAGSLLLKDVLKDEPVADDKRKLKVHNGNCDCC